MSSAIRNPLLNAAQNPSRSITAPTLPVRQLITHMPTKGFDISSISYQHLGPEQGHIAPNPLTITTHNHTPQAVADHWHGPNFCPMDVDSATPVAASATTSSTPDIMRTLINYQTRADVAKAQPAFKPVKKRKRRTCAKCARPECSGSQKSSNCRNPCQDCNKTACRGRNSSRPTKPCNTPGLWDK